MYATASMADIEKRRGYVPRRAWEQQAYRTVLYGSATGVAGVVTLALSIVGLMGVGIPIVLFILTAVFVFRFMRITGQR
jgi:hypothetical protein